MILPRTVLVYCALKIQDWAVSRNNAYEVATEGNLPPIEHHAFKTADFGTFCDKLHSQTWNDGTADPWNIWEKK
ncbi:unnamed protein product [Toxocara canis]|uniref:ACAS_N domain-containing protein n=1 Tax=Toxocara canis TaxID=6265 RepID=A0A183UK02_TOXCA|nr:unnamed protein product [Toxocara canis]